MYSYTQISGWLSYFNPKEKDGARPFSELFVVLPVKYI